MTGEEGPPAALVLLALHLRRLVRVVAVSRALRPEDFAARRKRVDQPLDEPRRDEPIGSAVNERQPGSSRRGSRRVGRPSRALRPSRRARGRVGPARRWPRRPTSWRAPGAATVCPSRAKGSGAPSRGGRRKATRARSRGCRTVLATSSATADPAEHEWRHDVAGSAPHRSRTASSA